MKWLGLVVLAAAVAAAFLLGDDGGSGAKGDAPRASLPVRAGFVGSETCKECHDARHKTWLQTAHAYSLREPDPDTVRGRFDGKPVESAFFTATPYRKGDEYWIRIEPKDDRPAGDHRVTRIVGRSFEQAYLMTGPKGEWRVLPLCWSLERQEWDEAHVILKDILGDAPYFPDNFDSRQQVFNHGCGQCHATGYDVGYDPEAQTYASSMLEGAVACESCHGQGSVHTAWHRKELDEGLKYLAPARLLHPKDDLDAKQVLETCGRCHFLHDWRYAISDDPLVPHSDIAVTKNMDRAGFFADGKLSGLNYHGSTQSQSACYLEGGMSCLHCHKMHGGKKFAMKWRGNDDAQCAKCHQGFLDRGKGHTFHDDVRCVDCHMPKFLTGVLHFSRDHRIASPEPELTERYGEQNSPNACGVCHKDKSPKWAREWREKWWGKTDRELVEDVGTIVALRQDAKNVATERLVAMAARGPGRNFFRLTALRALGTRDGAAATQAVLKALSSDHTGQVQVAVDILARRPKVAAVAHLWTLLGHSSRPVRVDAAYALARLGARATTGPMQSAYRDAVAMLDRQRHFVHDLQKIAMLADAVGDVGGARLYFDRMLRLSKWGTAAWPLTAVELLHRRARRRTEAGRHKEAVDLYAEVRSLLTGRSLPPLLFLDSADSLSEIGRDREAMAIWAAVASRTTAGNVLHKIARARLDGKALAALQKTVADLEADPVGGEALRRVRWSLEKLRKP